MLVGKPHRDKADLEWFATSTSQSCGRTWSDLLDSTVVDWKGFFDSTLCREVGERWDAAQAAIGLRKRPSARVKRDRARARAYSHNPL